MENILKNGNNQFYKKWWFWVIIILIVSASGIVYVCNNRNAEFNNYKKQSITILTQYRDGKLTRKETEEKIEAIADKLGNEYKVNDETNIYLLKSKLSSIAYKLFDEELSNTLINQYIQAIKEID